MRKKAIFIITCFLLLSGTGCKNDLNLLAPYKDVTVVYGLLDQNDTTHYIRINKAYEGPGNALTMAQQYDSINYPAGTLNVQLQDYDVNNNLVQTVTLNTTMNIPVQPGLFSYPNQIEYFTKASLNPSDTYKLVITNEKTGKVTSGTTYLLPDVVLSLTPSQFLPMSWNQLSPSSIAWNSIPNGVIYQMTFRVFYTEKNQPAHDSIQYHIDWVFAPMTTSIITGGAPLSYSYLGTGLLQFLKASIQPAGPGITRRCDSVDIVFSTGSTDFSTYSSLSQPSLGINQNKPFFTDLTNGIGIFSARHTQTYKKQLTPSTIDSIQTDALTSDLGFVP